jgi:hypothetical protein
VCGAGWDRGAGSARGARGLVPWMFLRV